MNGWVKLHRQIGENVFLMNDNNAYMVFTKLLYMANSKGEWAGGRFKLAERVNLNPNTLYKVLQRLEREHLVNIRSNNKYTIYCICNWHKYQSNGNRSSNNTVTSGEHHSNTLVRIKNKELEKPTADKLGVGYKSYINKRKQLGL